MMNARLNALHLAGLKLGLKHAHKLKHSAAKTLYV